MRHLSILLSVVTSVLKYTIFLFCCVQAQAQLKIDGFSERILDTSANAPATRVLDNNGETCALIKIFAPRTDGFHCDGGAKGIMKEEVKGGELWIFVPASAQRLIISHTLFGRIEYDYPESLKKGSTYQLLLNVGLGRFITINSSRIGADVEVDGQYIGQTPLYNQYLLYGPHTIKATNGKWEGTMEHLVSANEAATDQQTVLTVPLQDQSQHYGQGRITVDNNADIYYAGRLVGTGSWLFDLREGTYEVETRKADSESARTTFTVKAGAQGNDLKVKAPTPHTGWLNLYTRPRNVTATDNGSPINLGEVQTLPVGAHQLSISRKGYVTLQREYTIHLNQTTADTIQLERVKYVKPFAFYFGGAFTIRSLSGLSGILGMVLYGHDLQASYTFGLAESDPVYWGGDLNTATKYKMNSIGVKYGYQFNLMRQLAITPQVGYAYNFLTANAAAAGNTVYGDGASSSAASLGAKIVLVPVQHLYFFVAPEYMFALSQDKNFKTITNSSNFSADGFAVNVGVLVNF